MSDDKLNRYDAEQMQQWATACISATGASDEVAAALSAGLVAGDLLGFKTHGLLRLRYNLQCLSEGKSSKAGQPEVLQQRPAIELWDANLLPGPYAMNLAVQRAIKLAQQQGTGTIVMRRAQHIAALAIYLEQAIDQDLLIQIFAATPSQQVVAPFGAKTAVFSPNPFAIGAPAVDTKVMFDISLSMTAAGKIRTAIAEGRELPYPALITPEGDYTVDAKSFIASPAAVIASLGGEQLGYKGTGLNLFSELWTLALSQYGRADAPAAEGDANSVWIQVIDPSALGDIGNFKQQVQAQLEAIQTATPITPEQLVRVPGQGAMQRRAEQLANGISYSAAIIKQLEWCAQQYQVALPAPLGG